MAVETREKSRNTWFPEISGEGKIQKMAQPSGVKKEGYYDIPMLKPPVWKWEIALYFFFEGISAGAYLLGALGKLFGQKDNREMTRAANYISLAALLPCPPLLIADLGQPEKFHHMLRVWKPKSPMNLGAWTLLAYSLPVGLLSAKQLTEDFSQIPDFVKKAGAVIPDGLVEVSGIPFSLIMLSYPGVLLSTTSTPVWSKTRFLGALFAASSLNTAVSATSLMLAASGKENDKITEKLEKVETIASAAEGAALAAYLKTSGKAAEPLTKGAYSRLFWIGAIGAGLVAPAVLKATSIGQKKSRAKKFLGSVLSLAGGLALKWAVTHAGKTSAENSQTTREATRPNEDNPGWHQ